MVTTTRAPLAIAAERVFPLAQLDDDAASDLFGQRAPAARPGRGPRPRRRADASCAGSTGCPWPSSSPPPGCARCRSRTSTARLDDRFALLRGGDRTAPDRHQTLLAVIDWSWNLLPSTERRALRWLSAFHDGFSLDGADAVLGHDALDDVRSLVDQSLLTVLDAGGTVRYRMLETVREFGRMQLVGAGEDAAARDAQLAWACGFALPRRPTSCGHPARSRRCARSRSRRTTSPTRCARRVTLPDPAAAVRADRGAWRGFWTVRGENTRVIAIARRVDAALAGWVPDPTSRSTWPCRPPRRSRPSTPWSARSPSVPAAWPCSTTYGDRHHSARVRGLVAVLDAQDAGRPDRARWSLARSTRARLRPRVPRAIARLWAAHHLENIGDPTAPSSRPALALARSATPTGRGSRRCCTPGRRRSTPSSASARRRRSTRCAALPMLDQLEANDDAIQAAPCSPSTPWPTGRLDEAERLIAEIERLSRERDRLRRRLRTAHCPRRAGRWPAGRSPRACALYRVAGERARRDQAPGHGAPPGSSRGRCSARPPAPRRTPSRHADSRGRGPLRALRGQGAAGARPGPAAAWTTRSPGWCCTGSATWGLLRERCPPSPPCGCWCSPSCSATTRFTPTMDPARTDGEAEERAPGLAARLRAEYGERTAARTSCRRPGPSPSGSLAGHAGLHLAA